MAQLSGFGKRWHAFTSSKRGQKWVTVSIIGASCLAGGAYIIPQTYGLGYIRDIFQLHFHGKPLPPSKEFLETVSEVYDDVGADVTSARKIRWFTVVGFDPISNGSVSLNGGALIGVPKSFYYKTIDDIDQNDIKLHMNENIPWQSVEGRALASCLLLSDDAIRFVIAREYYLAANSAVILRASGISGLVFAYFLTNKALMNMTKLQQNPTRILLYMGTAALYILMSLIGNDFLTCLYEKSVDRKTAALGEKYIRGGYEFYAKHLQRNRVLRVLLKEQGMANYSAEGNLNVMFRQPHLPISTRRDYFYKRLYGDEESAAKTPSDAAVNDAVQDTTSSKT